MAGEAPLNGNAHERKPIQISRYVLGAGRQSVPALEVPPVISHCHEDEMLSWLRYPMEDSFDKNYCSEEPDLEGISSHLDIFHEAFSNLTIREATHTWRVPETREDERISAAKVAMAMGAQRAAGLLFQSGADTFNKVRTNARPPVAKGEETASWAPKVIEPEKPGSSHEHVAFPNFCLFSRTGRVAEQGMHGALEATQKPTLGFSCHTGGYNCNQTVRVTSHFPFWKKVEQSSAISDRLITKEKMPSLCFRQKTVSYGPDAGFSRSAAHPSVKLGAPLKLLTKGYIVVDGIQSSEPSSMSSGLESKTVDWSTQGSATLSSLTSLTAKQCLHGQGPPAATSCVGGLMVDPKCKRTRAELEAKYPSSQDASSQSISTGITDVDSCRMSKRAHCIIDAKSFLAGSNVSVCPTNLQKNISWPVRTSSRSALFDSPICEYVGMADVYMASPSRLWVDGTSRSVMDATTFGAKKKTLFLDNSDIQRKPFKDEDYLQRHAF